MADCARGGIARDNSFQRSGLTDVRGRGILPTWRSVLKDGLRRVAVPNGARAHKPEGIGSLV